MQHRYLALNAPATIGFTQTPFPAFANANRSIMIPIVGNLRPMPRIRAYSGERNIYSGQDQEAFADAVSKDMRERIMQHDFSQHCAHRPQSLMDLFVGETPSSFLFGASLEIDPPTLPHHTFQVKKQRIAGEDTWFIQEGEDKSKDLLLFLDVMMPSVEIFGGGSEHVLVSNVDNHRHDMPATIVAKLPVNELFEIRSKDPRYNIVQIRWTESKKLKVETISPRDYAIRSSLFQGGIGASHHTQPRRSEVTPGNRPRRESVRPHGQ